MDTIEELKQGRLPGHLAIIMDGNGRWAKQRGKLRVFGHEHGVQAVRKTVETSARLGIRYLTLYAFSTENWNRPKMEVDTLMRLLVTSLRKEFESLNKNNIRLRAIGRLDTLPPKLEVDTLMGLLVTSLRKEFESLNKNNIRLRAIGRLDTLPPKVHTELMEAIEQTSGNTGMTLTVALSYGSREELTSAFKALSVKVKNNIISPEKIDETIINDHLYTHDLPDVDLLIRTSGEHRISNFLLWQIAYAELYFTEVFWPDFGEEHLFEAVKSYQNRERRFGKTSEQLI